MSNHTPSGSPIVLREYLPVECDEDPCDLRVINRRATEDAKDAEWWERHDRDLERSE